jgi:hypothetical protein
MVSLDALERDQPLVQAPQVPCSSVEPTAGIAAGAWVV